MIYYVNQKNKKSVKINLKISRGSFERLLSIET